MADFSQPSPDRSACVDDFMRLYTQHQRRLYVYLLSLVHNVNDAEELLQECSFVLWKKFDEFQPDTNFGAWSCRVAYFEVLKFLESRNQGEQAINPRFLERVAERATEISDLFEMRGEAFQHCMEKLGEPDRRLIVRRYTPGVSVKLLADELSRPPRSVSKSLSRIRKTLNDCIDLRVRHEKREAGR